MVKPMETIQVIQDEYDFYQAIDSEIEPTDRLHIKSFPDVPSPITARRYFVAWCKTRKLIPEFTQSVDSLLERGY